VIVKKNEKKGYNSFRDDVYSIKELIEEKRREIRELESNLRSITKINSDDDNEESERGKIKRQIKRMEKELKNLQRKL
jgi:DNA-binding transcriptional regulator GbsR (MarR family)